MDWLVDMDGLYKSIRLNQVNLRDRSFEIRSFVPLNHLEASLERSGILFPPWLLKTGENEYVVVDGFKRLGWLQSKGHPEAECFVFPIESDREGLLIRRIEGKLFGLPLNVAEKAQLISQLVNVISWGPVMERFLRVLNVAFRPEAVERWTVLAAADETLLKAAAFGVVSDRAALELANWEREVMAEMVVLMMTLRCSASVQMEIIERITCAAKRHGTEKVGLLRDSRLQDILNDSRRNHREKTQALRELLTGWAFPRLCAREKRFVREVCEAALPKGVRLMHPSAFEGERWQLQLEFSTPEDLYPLLETVERFARSRILRKILSPTAPQE